MSLQDLANIGEFVGGVAVIVSLVFIGFQIRQNTRSIRAQSELELSQRYADFHGRANQTPNMRRLWDEALDNPEEMSAEDIRDLRWMNAEQFLIFEGVYQLYIQGQISEESWRIKRDFLKAVLEHPVIKEWWEHRVTPLSAEFVKHIDEHRVESPDAWSWKKVSERIERDG